MNAAHSPGATDPARRKIRGSERGVPYFWMKIGDMPLPAQAKLLRVLQERRIQRIGGTTDIDLDFSRDCRHKTTTLKTEMRAGTLPRRFILQNCRVSNHYPAPCAIDAKIFHCWRNHFHPECAQPREKQVIGIASRWPWAFLMQYRFPGNVRELKNIIERSVSA